MILVMALVAVEPPAPPAPSAPRLPTVEIVVPTHNEAHVLDASVTRLSRFLNDRFPLPWRITIADNGSTDGTSVVARPPGPDACRTSPSSCCRAPGGAGRCGRRGCAAGPTSSPTPTSTCPPTSTPCCRSSRPLISGHSDVAVGSRLAWGARTGRGIKREVISRALQPPAAAHPAHAGARRPVRLQGDERRRRPPAPAGRPRRRLVLRHRAADPGQARRLPGVRGAGRLGRRRRTRGSRSCARRGTTSVASPGWRVRERT